MPYATSRESRPPLDATRAPTVEDLRAAIESLSRQVAVLQALKAKRDEGARQLAANRAAMERAEKHPPRSAFTVTDFETFAATVAGLSDVVRTLQERAGLTRPGEPMAQRWS